ncbi:DUF420 domain-containing protein [Planctomyces sp. SH-PL62]|uniref:DUF420 domain-containing protein n=1 Tax=Planctomyces sp. SH-PL62 TaxID=1636152 RepID=UPI00078B7409|nr:DUF420 domain-containing protein [Planctomyces sp. SH-PL62]AMV36668.1 hypothetical protein VT85_04510 [Planctomyces sp. SH-PL62]
MQPAYPRGVLTVVLAIVLSGGLCLAWVRATDAARPAGQDLGEASTRLGSFALVERSGEAVTDADFADRVAVVSFVFTRCQLSCPRITSIMKSLQDRLAGADVQLVSLSVDPEYDTPEVLRDYADRFGADRDRWWFLTGPRDPILAMINEKFHLTAMTNPTPAADGSDEAVVHSDRLALVDRGTVIGLFDSREPKALEDLVAKARRLASPRWIRTLPAVNATLNGLCTVLLLAGWVAIRRPSGSASLAATEALASPTAPGGSTVRARLSALFGNPATRGHLLAMSLALLTSAVFLSCYLVYHFFAGGTKFAGHGWILWLYLTILLSHTLLATFFVVPLVALTVIRALKGDYARHARIAQVAFPIWLYVSITGVVIYLMLYQLPLAELGSPSA